VTSSARAGMAILVLYLVVAAATIGLGAHRVRPLFEGIGPSAPYRWVKPPPLFAPDNVAPKPLTADIPFPEMDKATQLGTGDGQFQLNVPAHGIRAEPGATSVRFVLTPADPGTLGPLPAGLRPAGNAYRAAFTYQPGGADASPAAVPGNVTLTVPEPVKAIVFSPDGRAWQALPAQLLGNVTTVGTTFSAAGWYLGAADAATAAPGQLAGRPSPGTRIGTLLIVALVVGLTVALVGIPALIRRRSAATVNQPRAARRVSPRGPAGSNPLRSRRRHRR